MKALPSLAVVVLAAVSCHPVRRYTVPTTAMEPTIKKGQLITALSLDADEPLRRGDVVVYIMPDTKDGRLGVKRVVGLPGEKIEIVDRRLLIDGTEANEPYVVHTDSTPHPPAIDTRMLLPGGPSAAMVAEKLKVRDNLPRRLVPPGTVFLLGDNRDSSWDSRFFGPVLRTCVVARVVLERPTKATT